MAGVWGLRRGGLRRGGLAGAGLAAFALAGCASIAPSGPAPTDGYAAGPGAASAGRPAAAPRSNGPPPWSPVGLPTDGKGRVRAFNRPYQIKGEWYSPAAQPGYEEVGVASWYGFESGQTTANGEVFLTDFAATAAHKTLPLPSRLQVTNLDNGRSIEVRLNDRGPFVPGRIIDLSREAARQLGFLEKGTAQVRVRYLGPAPIEQTLQSMQIAVASPYPAMSTAPVRPAPAAPKDAGGVKDSMELVAGLP
jgi:rare lipoprotein A